LSLSVCFDRSLVFDRRRRIIMPEQSIAMNWTDSELNDCRWLIRDKRLADLFLGRFFNREMAFLSISLGWNKDLSILWKSASRKNDT
jgi:hypothetical protein